MNGYDPLMRINTQTYVHSRSGSSCRSSRASARAKKTAKEYGKLSLKCEHQVHLSTYGTSLRAYPHAWVHTNTQTEDYRCAGRPKTRVRTALSRAQPHQRNTRTYHLHISRWASSWRGRGSELGPEPTVPTPPYSCCPWPR